MAKILLTQKIIDQTSCPADQRKIELSDQQQPGFFIEFRYGSAYGTYYQRVTDRGSRKTYKLGTTNELMLKAARNLASEMRAKHLSGELARNEIEQKATMSLNAFFDQVYYPQCVKDKRAKSAYAERSLYNSHVRSTLGNQPMNFITRKDVVILIQSIKNRGLSAATINKVICTIRVVFRYAITLDYLSDSEVLSTKLLTDTAKKERFLSIEETQRLLTVLDSWHVQPVALLLKLLIFTGARSGEAMKANWADIDFEKRVWKIPIENDKIKQGRLLPLNDSAIAILQQAWDLREHGQVEVFRSIQCKSRYLSLQLSWYKIRIAAGIPDVRVHDLRHSFASHLIQHKVPIAEISTLLGHRNIKTTMRYAHLDQTTIRESSQIMDRLFQPNPP